MVLFQLLLIDEIFLPNLSKDARTVASREKDMGTSKAQFTIVYDGKALENNTMYINDLAPALLAFADVFTETNKVLNGSKASVNVSVKAFKSGCFGIDLEVAQSTLSHMADFFSEGSKVRDALELLSLLGFTVKEGLVTTGVGLILLLKKMHGKNPEEILPLEHGQAKIVFTDVIPKATSNEVAFIDG